MCDLQKYREFLEISTTFQDTTKPLQKKKFLNKLKGDDVNHFRGVRVLQQLEWEKEDIIIT